MVSENAILINKDLVPQYEDAGIAATINAVAAQYKRGQDILTAINDAISLPDLTWETFLRIFTDLKAAGFLNDGVVLLGETLPDPIERPARVGGISADGSFFSTPTSGTYNIRVFKNGAFVYQATGVDIAVNRSLNNTGFIAGDVMQVGLELGGVVGWWGRVTIA